MQLRGQMLRTQVISMHRRSTRMVLRSNSVGVQGHWNTARIGKSSLWRVPVLVVRGRAHCQDLQCLGLVRYCTSRAGASMFHTNMEYISHQTAYALQYSSCSVLLMYQLYNVLFLEICSPNTIVSCNICVTIGIQILLNGIIMEKEKKSFCGQFHPCN